MRTRASAAQSNRGNAFRALGNVAAAKASYDAALLIDPLDSRTWNNRGALQEDLGNLVAAELDLRRSLELDPNCPRAEGNRSRIATALQRADLELQPLRPYDAKHAAAAAAAHDGVIETFKLEDGPIGIVVANTYGSIQVTKVEADSQAERIGLKPLGLIVGFNGEVVGNIEPSELTRMVASSKPPRVLKVRYPPHKSTANAADAAAGGSGTAGASTTGAGAGTGGSHGELGEHGIDALARNAEAQARAAGAEYVPPPGDFSDGGMVTDRGR